MSSAARGGAVTAPLAGETEAIDFRLVALGTANPGGRATGRG